MASRSINGIEKHISNYIMQPDDIKEICRNYVFNRYLSRADNDYEEALDSITGDMYILESIEEYESCLILKDILNDFG